MCGIIGANQTDFNPKSLLDSLKHRGPDAQEYLIKKGLFLGHTRLSIIDLHKEANQPMTFDNITLVFNGEIYNYRALQREHKLNCKTKSDSEVIIRLYQKYGSAFLNYLDGMFAFCLFNHKTEEFFCARDRFGKKPFYYFHNNDTFYFASEIKTLIKMLGYTPELNREALWQYLAFQSPQENHTFYTGIKKLQASHFLKFRLSTLSTHPYYTLNNIDITHFNKPEIYKHVDTLLNESVEKRLVGDVEVASLLSGGLDSSLITALYTKISPQKVHTFSIGYDEYSHYCELPYAKNVAQMLKTQHHAYTIGRDDFLETIDLVLEQLDEPLADSACIPTYLLSQQVHKEGFKVSLSGEGSDESFLGYDNYFTMLKHYEEKPPIPEKFNFSKEWEYHNRRIKNRTIYHSNAETFTSTALQKLSRKKLKSIPTLFPSAYSPTQWLSYIDFSIWIPEVLMTKVDRMSMAHSLEIRAPFLDHHLVEYLMAVDPIIKRGSTNKETLKEIAKQYLPSSVINRKKKGFSSPFIEWLYDGHHKEILNIMLRVNNELNLFNNEVIIYLYEEGREGRYKQHLYSLYIFCRWYQKVYM